MTKGFQELSKILEDLIKSEEDILGSALFDPEGQVVLGTQNILKGNIELKNQSIDCTYVGYVSTAVSEKIRSASSPSSSQVFDDIFLLDEENALFTKTIQKTGYNLVLIAKKTITMKQKIKNNVEEIAKDLEKFIIGS